MSGYLYPYTASQLAAVSAEALLAFIKSPTMVARRLGEIMNAQSFIGNFLLQGRYQIQGGAIAVPTNEVIRTDRPAETVAAGAEYKLTPLSREQLEVYTTLKRGIATEVTDEQVTRLLRQPIDDAFLLLTNELVTDANEMALGVIGSSVTSTVASSAVWTAASGAGKNIVRDVLRAKAAVSARKLGFQLDTVVLNEEDYAQVMPDVLDLLPDSDRSVITGAFPNVLGLTWVTGPDADNANPLLVDRSRLGGIAREKIQSPEYRSVGEDTGVEIAAIREPKADKTRLQARNPHVPIVTQPLAGIQITGTGL